MSLKNLSVIDGDPWSQDFPFDLLTFLEACQVWEAWPIAITNFLPHRKEHSSWLKSKHTSKELLSSFLLFLLSTLWRIKPYRKTYLLKQI